MPKYYYKPSGGAKMPVAHFKGHYALTASGLDKVEAGLTGKSYLQQVLGALMDLEEKHEGKKAHTLSDIQSEGHLTTYVATKGLNHAVSRGYIEIVQPGDDRFIW